MPPITIKSTIKSLGNLYHKSSLWCKLLIFIVLFLTIIYIFKILPYKPREGFTQNDQFLIKTGPEIYDDFYADVYDHLVFNNLKDDYEVGAILNLNVPASKSRILDVGCGTGHHVGMLGSNGLDVLGIDISPSMIKKAKENFPDYKFQVADATNGNIFGASSFTHILCMYFTIYYFPDRNSFIHNCFMWLMPGGYFIVHLVDRNKFDPILPPGNPLMYVSPQRYAKKRITSTKVKFHDFSYSADFKLNETNNLAQFVEKFKDDNTGKVRKNEHTLYMDDTQQIVNEITSVGFTLESKIDLLQCQYEYQYLYVFVKPN